MRRIPSPKSPLYWSGSTSPPRPPASRPSAPGLPPPPQARAPPPGWEPRLRRRGRWSRPGPPRSLEGFDWAARPQLSPQVVKELLTCRFIDEHRNVILVGRPSTGKTTVAKALGHAARSHAL